MVQLFAYLDILGKIGFRVLYVLTLRIGDMWLSSLSKICLGITGLGEPINGDSVVFFLNTVFSSLEMAIWLAASFLERVFIREFFNREGLSDGSSLPLFPLSLSKRTFLLWSHESSVHVICFICDSTCALFATRLLG